MIITLYIFESQQKRALQLFLSQQSTNAFKHFSFMSSSSFFSFLFFESARAVGAKVRPRSPAGYNQART